MSEEKSNFEKSLIMVAKELERLSRIRESRMEFEREMSSAPSGRPQPFKCSLSSLPEASQNCDLELTCESDASYDVEEVRYQNFLARNRITSRSNVIKTLVYRVPESAYVVKRTQVYVDEPNDQKQDEKPADTTISVSSEKKPQIKSSNNLSLNESQTKSKKDQQQTDKKPSAANIKEKKDVKYTEEDMIMIDDEDDIIGAWTTSDEEEEEENKKKAQPSPSSETVLDQNEQSSKNRRRESRDDEDDEEFSSDENSSSYGSENSMESDVEGQSSAIDDEEDTTEEDIEDDESIGEDDDEDDDESYSLKRPVNQRLSGSGQKPVKKLKQGRPGRPRIHPLPETAPIKGVKSVAKRGRGRPRVVTERAVEPISTQTVVVNFAKNAKKSTTPKSNLSIEQEQQKQDDKRLRPTRSRSKLVE